MIMRYVDFLHFCENNPMSYDSWERKTEMIGNLPPEQEALYRKVCKQCEKLDVSPPPKSCFDPRFPTYITGYDSYWKAFLLSLKNLLCNPFRWNKMCYYDNRPFWLILPFRTGNNQRYGLIKAGKFPIHVHANSFGEKFSSFIPVFITSTKEWVLTNEYRLPCGGYSLNIFKGYREPEDRLTKNTSIREFFEEAGLKDDINYEIVNLNRPDENNGLSFVRNNLSLILLHSIDTSKFGESNEGNGRTVILSTKELFQLMRYGMINDLQTHSSILIATFELVARGYLSSEEIAEFFRQLEGSESSRPRTHATT